MFATILGYATKALPYITTVATHPTTIKIARHTAIASGASIAVTAVSFRAVDHYAQTKAEILHQELDPLGYANDTRPVTTFRQRVGRGFVAFSKAVVAELKAFRAALLTIPLLVAYGAYKRSSAKWDRMQAAHPEHERFHSEVEYADLHPEEKQFCTRYERALNRYENRVKRFYKIRGWVNSPVALKGALYLDDMIASLAPVPTGQPDVVDTYLDALKEIPLDAAVFQSSPFMAGRQLRDQVSQALPAQGAAELVRDHILKEWIATVTTLTPKQWSQVIKGWNRAEVLTPSGKE